MANIPYQPAPSLEESLRQLILNNQQNTTNHHAVNADTINNDVYSNQRPSAGAPVQQVYQLASGGSPQLGRPHQMDQNVPRTRVNHRVEHRINNVQHPPSPIRHSPMQRAFSPRELKPGSSGPFPQRERGNFQRGPRDPRLQASPSVEDFPPLGANGPVVHPPPVPNTSPRSQFPVTRGCQSGRGRGSSFSLQNSHGRASQASYAVFHAEQSRRLDELARSIITLATPPESEGIMKRKLLLRLEKICRDVIPGARLVPFGSLVTGFATASSDIDCIFTLAPETPDDDVDKPPLPDINEMPLVLDDAFKQAGFEVLVLSRTRVPIIKLVAKPTEEIPTELQCDIGFSNDLAIHNTQLLRHYALCDSRVKSMVLFIKWWAKKRHINSPYRGTLSSYGYVLLILHYLMNVANPPVLPNLQTIPMPPNVPHDEVFVDNHDKRCNVWFFKHLEQVKESSNRQTIGELLRGFFDYYAYSFVWGYDVVSIRTEGGLLTKEQKDWMSAKTRPGNTNGNGEGETWEVKDRYLLAIEDPFEITHNVGRTCTANGVYRIRDELRRAMRMIKSRDNGQTLKNGLFVEAPPERPFVRREDMPKKDSATENQPADGVPPVAPTTEPTALQGQPPSPHKQLILSGLPMPPYVRFAEQVARPMGPHG